MKERWPMAKWYTGAYARGVVDMHITDHDPSFMSRFGPDECVKMLRRSRIRSIVLYAHSHVGLCYFPTKVGRLHPGLRDPNALSKVVDGCHAAGIAVVMYMSGIYDTWAYKREPDWRITDANGNEAAANSRYGICCPNSPYRDHIAALAREVCEGYEFEGVRFDMTFWPRICYCRHCAARYDAEVGGELPRVINWHDPVWTGFQRKREEWLIDFAHHLTDTVRRYAPGVSVEHQSSTFAHGFGLGVTHGLAGACDFLQGDFYGDALQGSFVRKLFLTLSPNQPYGFETSIGIDLANYTALKSQDLLRTKAAAATADHGAFIFIDSIDPVGTLNPSVFERMGDVFEEVEPYASHLGGDPMADVAIYLSTESKCDFADNGRTIDSSPLTGALPHVDAAVGAARACIENHIPYGVITKRSLAGLGRYQVLVLPNVLMMDDEEVAAIREFVREGGKLYASAWTSLVTKDGRLLDDFALGEVLGVSHRGWSEVRFSYLAPLRGGDPILPGYTREHPLGFAGHQALISAADGAGVLATLALPFGNPDDPTRYASIHNNPPFEWTDEPAIFANDFGRGRAVYCAADVERFAEHTQAFLALLNYLGADYRLRADAPPCVEVSAVHQPDRDRYVVSVLNFQKQLPNVPVRDVRIRLRVGARTKSVTLLPDGERLSFRPFPEAVEFTVPEVERLAMVAVAY